MTTPFCSERWWRAARREYDINFEPDELGGDVVKWLRFCPAILDHQVAPLDPSQLSQPLDSGGDPSPINLTRAPEPTSAIHQSIARRDANRRHWVRVGCIHEDPDASHALLGACAKRHCDRCAQSRDEGANSCNQFAPSHRLSPRLRTTSTGLCNYTSKAGNSDRRNGVRRSICTAEIPTRAQQRPPVVAFLHSGLRSGYEAARMTTPDPVRHRIRKEDDASAKMQRDKQTMPYSITSSARASSVGGTVRPSALAVLRLIASSYLVGACTGRSDGFSPFRIRST